MDSEPRLDWSNPTPRQIKDVTMIPTANQIDPRYDGSATPKQLAFAQSLAQQLGLTDKLTAEMERGHGLSKARASALIERLLELRDTAPAKPTGTATGLDLSPLAGGYYAAEVDGVTKFFRIDKPTEGRWAGWMFVKIQASDDLHPQGKQAPGRSYTGASIEYLRVILADEQAAFARYGQAIGRCGVCGRTLTDETSRARGIGPTCFERYS